MNCVCGEEGCLPVSVSPYYAELRCLNILQLRVYFSEPPDLECALTCGCGHMCTHHCLWNQSREDNDRNGDDGSQHGTLQMHVQIYVTGPVYTVTLTYQVWKQPQSSNLQ